MYAFILKARWGMEKIPTSLIYTSNGSSIEGGSRPEQELVSLSRSCMPAYHKSVLNFFKRFRFNFLSERQIYRKKEIQREATASLFTPKWSQWPKRSPSEAWNKGLPWNCRVPRTFILFHWFSRHLSMELDWKWGS